MRVNCKKCGNFISSKKVHICPKENPMKGKKRPDLSLYNTNTKKGKSLIEQHGKKKAKNITKANSQKHKGELNSAKRPEVRKKISEQKDGNPNYKLRGENNIHWKGGITDKYYPYEFSNYLKKQIRKRDKQKCCICKSKQLNRKLCIHHIDYNKENSKSTNLISLCNSCHVKTNDNRIYWKLYFKIKFCLRLWRTLK